MDEHQYRRKPQLLWGLILIATVYSLWFYRFQALTGMKTLDGTFSVLFGLYICSHPAANAVDLLFFERKSYRRIISNWSTAQWLALNILTLLMGWIVIVIGTTHLTSQGG